MNTMIELKGVENGTVPTVAELIERARAMVPVLRERAPEVAAQRQVHQETIAEFHEAGFFRILQPERWGGYEMHPNDFYEVVMILAEGDMSAAWVLSVVGVHAWQIACWDPRLQEEVWGKDTRTLASSTYMPGGLARKVEGGYRFSGRWGYSSGSEFCQWVILGGRFTDEEGNPVNDGGNFILPRSDYDIVDTWETPGLRGTGSNDIVVNDVFVPEYRVMAGPGTFMCDLPGQAINPGTLYRMPFGQVFSRAVTTASIGALQGMINQMIETARTRANLFGTRTFQDPVATQALAEAQNEVDQMKLVLRRNFDALWSYAERRELPPVELRSQFRFQAALPPERVSVMAARLFKAVGGAAVYSGRTAYAQILNDIMVGRQHIAAQFEVFARNWGAVLMGQENSDFFL